MHKQTWLFWEVSLLNLETIMKNRKHSLQRKCWILETEGVGWILEKRESGDMNTLCLYINRMWQILNSLMICEISIQWCATVLTALWRTHTIHTNLIRYYLICALLTSTSNDWLVNLSLNLSDCLSVCLSVGIAVYLSTSFLFVNNVCRRIDDIHWQWVKSVYFLSDSEKRTVMECVQEQESLTRQLQLLQ